LAKIIMPGCPKVDRYMFPILEHVLSGVHPTGVGRLRGYSSPRSPKIEI